MQLRSQPATIIGVLPPGFSFLHEMDIWEPMGLDPARDYRISSGRGPSCAARLKPGVSLEQAQAEMSAIAARLEAAYPAFDRYWGVNLEPLRDAMVREVKTSILVLLGAVGLLLLVACANVANLLLARHTTRQRRSRCAWPSAPAGRVVRQLLTESLLLSIAGGLLGLALARAAVVGLVALAPADLAQGAHVAVDYRVALAALGLSLLTGILFGMAPSWMASRDKLSNGLRDASRSNAGSGLRARSLLVAAEVALSLVLLTGAGLLFRSLTGLQHVDSGLDPRGLLTFRVTLPGARYRQPKERTRFIARAIDQLSRIPGVESASAINTLPFAGIPSGTRLAIAGRPKPPVGEEPTTRVRSVMPGYFRTMGIPVTRGRDSTPEDNAAQAPYRFVVSETFVRRHLRGDEPLGKQISVSMQDQIPSARLWGWLET